VDVFGSRPISSVSAAPAMITPELVTDPPSQA
jgi:hypothetical protein